MKDGLPFSISFGGFFKTEFDMYYNSLSLRRHYPDQVHGYNLSPLFLSANGLSQTEVLGYFLRFLGTPSEYFTAKLQLIFDI